eukprot:Lankesteria_metandrocarpae@DN5500_c0_g1_i1.p1
MSLRGAERLLTSSALYRVAKGSVRNRIVSSNGGGLSSSYDRLSSGGFSTVACASTPLRAGESSTESSVLSPVCAWAADSRIARQQWSNFGSSLKCRFGFGAKQNGSENTKQKVVLLGTGWSTMKFLPLINTSKYEVSVVSPRNYFVFTPLLPSVCAGSLSARSCVEPIRRFTVRGGKKVIDMYQGHAEDVDFGKNTLTVAHRDGRRFDLKYDALIIGVGSEAATFGIPGVAENAYFLKEAENAEDIRRKVLENFETAQLPTTTEPEQRRLLHFVCVGGGPSGVEVAAELGDLVNEEISSLYPNLRDLVTISVVEMLPKVLPMFNQEVSEFTIRNFKKMRIQALLNTRVTKVTPKSICVVSDGKDQELPCGFVLWASGIGQVPFAKKVMSKIPSQQKNRPAVMNVDQCLRLKGVTGNNVFAFGDCSFMAPTQLAAHADELFEDAQKHSSKAGTEYLKNTQPLLYRFPQLHPSKMCVKKDSNNLTKPEFISLLKEVDAGYRPPVPTAQNAGQEGLWLAGMMNDFDIQTDKNKLPSFVENFKGALAYVGHGESVALTPWFNILGGFHSTLFWKTVYWTMQMSFTNQALLLTDWVRVKFAGRDVSCMRNSDLSSVAAPRASGSSSPPLSPKSSAQN